MPATINWKTNTASKAPTGSIRMPSQRSSWLTFGVARMVRSSGLITVGPVTTTRAANSSAISTENPVTAQVPAAISPQLSSAPQLTILLTAAPWPRRSPSRRVRPPSNNTSATPRETIGNRMSPNISSGRSRSVIGPATIPITSRARIDGSFSRQDSHWAAIPSTITAAMTYSRLSFTRIFPRNFERARCASTPELSIPPAGAAESSHKPGPRDLKPV